jgi:Leucine Rich Repeat (LRR) protein
MSRRNTPGSALENLKREAKRWLKALRGNVEEARARLVRAFPGARDAPTLRDVQHALAREHGFAGWSALKAQLTQANAGSTRPTVADYERKAVNLLDAYRTGTPEAMQRHWSDTWHRRTWETMRRYVQLDLGKRPDVEGGDVEITLDDARAWVARDHGFESWPALVEYVRSLPGEKRLIAATPVRLFSDDDSAGEDESTRDWDRVAERLGSGNITALEANGQMTDEVLERISALEHVTTLRLSGSRQLTDVGVRHLARMRDLRHLDLSGCPVSDRSLEILRELPALETLSLAWTGVTDAGVEQLSRCDQLARVDLSGTRTGDGAIKALAGKSRLSHFKSGNAVTEAGLPALHDFPVFKTWRGGEVSLALLSPDAEPNLLGLRGTFTDRGMSQLAGLDGLFGLNIDDRNLPVTAAGLAPLVTLPNLGFLAFDATDESMPYIAAMPRLRFIMCQDTVAGDDGFAALSRSRSIEYIWGRRCYNLGGRGFSALASMPALRGLSLSCKNVDDDGLSALPRFPALRELMPMDVPDDGFRHVGRCERLESLVLMYCRDTGDLATQHIATLPHLKKYFASYTRITDRSLAILATMTSLEQIELSGVPGVTNDGVALLAGLPRLRELRLSGMQSLTRDSVAGFPPRVRVRFAP